MAFLEAGMFGIGVPEIGSLLFLAVILFAGGRKFGGGQPPTHPLPGRDLKLGSRLKDSGAD